MKIARSILIVDDEQSILDSLGAILEEEGYEVFTAASGEEAFSILSRKSVHTVLLDIWMEPMDGLLVLKKIRAQFLNVDVIMMSGHGTIETAVSATKLGAFDYIEKPLSLEKLLVILKNLSMNQQLREENQRLRLDGSMHQEMIGLSSVILEIKKLIELIAPTNSWVLITGENGTGKELVAKALHERSRRNEKAFVAVNCAAIPENLIESELFGHEKGAFTGAVTSKKGKFDVADGGTLFLDEIADMSLNTQAKILRILQERKFTRVGGEKTIEVDVRVFAATNKDLKKEIELGRFREDLYYRLNVIPFHISPLRERKEDIEPLACYFLNIVAQDNGKTSMKFTKEAFKKLKNYSWPGNIRELRNLVERFAIMAKANTISEDNIVLPREEEVGKQYPAQLRQAREDFEREFILSKLHQCGGNVSKTAQLIGVERTHLHRKLKQYDIKTGENF